MNLAEAIDRYARKLGPARGQSNLFAAQTSLGRKKQEWDETKHPRNHETHEHAGQFASKHSGGAPVRIVDHGRHHIAHVKNPRTGESHQFKGHSWEHALRQVHQHANSNGYLAQTPKKEEDLGGLFGAQKSPSSVAKIKAEHKQTQQQIAPSKPAPAKQASLFDQSPAPQPAKPKPQPKPEQPFQLDATPDKWVQPDSQKPDLPESVNQGPKERQTAFFDAGKPSDLSGQELLWDNSPTSSTRDEPPKKELRTTAIPGGITDILKKQIKLPDNALTTNPNGSPTFAGNVHADLMWEKEDGTKASKEDIAAIHHASTFGGRFAISEAKRRGIKQRAFNNVSDAMSAKTNVTPKPQTTDAFLADAKQAIETAHANKSNIWGEIKKQTGLGMTDITRRHGRDTMHALRQHSESLRETTKTAGEQQRDQPPSAARAQAMEKQNARQAADDFARKSQPKAPVPEPDDTDSDDPRNKSFDDIMAENKGLVVSIANKYATTLNRDDMLNRGYMGLHKAHESFDPSKGKWGSHAYTYVLNEIRSAGRNGLTHKRNFANLAASDDGGRSENELVDNRGENEMSFENKEAFATLIKGLSDSDKEFMVGYWSGGDKTSFAVKNGVSRAAVEDRYNKLLGKLQRVAKDKDMYQLDLEVQQYARELSDAQKEAGNYKKQKKRWQGLEVTIENPKGSVRSGSGWSVVMQHDYGYINRTTGKDGDQVDIFLGPDKQSDIVFIVDQVDMNGKFDEHKVMAGFSNRMDAKTAYLANYSKGWKCGEITGLTMKQFRKWLETGDQNKIVADKYNLQMMVDRYAKQQRGFGQQVAHGITDMVISPFGKKRGVNRLLKMAIDSWMSRNQPEAPAQQPDSPAPPQQLSDFEKKHGLQAGDEAKERRRLSLSNARKELKGTVEQQATGKTAFERQWGLDKGGEAKLYNQSLQNQKQFGHGQPKVNYPPRAPISQSPTAAQSAASAPDTAADNWNSKVPQGAENPEFEKKHARDGGKFASKPGADKKEEPPKPSPAQQQVQQEQQRKQQQAAIAAHAAEQQKRAQEMEPLQARVNGKPIDGTASQSQERDPQAQSREDAGKQAKAQAMQQWAQKQAATPGTRQHADAQQRAESNHTGKPVSVDGKNGKVSHNSFGKTVVSFDDGTTSRVDAEQIQPPTQPEPPAQSEPPWKSSGNITVNGPQTVPPANPDTPDYSPPDPAERLGFTPPAESPKKPSPDNRMAMAKQMKKTEFDMLPNTVRAAIHKSATENEVDPLQLWEEAQNEHHAALEHHNSWTEILKDARKQGLNKATTRRQEEAGFDHSTQYGFDKILDEAVNNNPHLDWGHDPADTLWNKLREGSQKAPKMHDPELLNKVAGNIWLRPKEESGGDAHNPDGYVPPEERDDYDPDDPDSVPFSRISDLSVAVERYAKAAVLTVV